MKDFIQYLNNYTGAETGAETEYKDEAMMFQAVRSTLAMIEPYLEDIRGQWDGDSDDAFKDRARAAEYVQDYAAMLLDELDTIENTDPHETAGRNDFDGQSDFDWSDHERDLAGRNDA